MNSPEPRAVLVLDDELDIVDVIGDILEKLEYRAITATNWTDALNAIQRDQPDLLLLDLNMPTIDGESILRFLREQGHTIPVIVVSGFINDEVKETLSQYDVELFIGKPVQVQALTQAIEQVIGPSQAPSQELNSSLSAPESPQDLETPSQSEKTSDTEPPAPSALPTQTPDPTPVSSQPQDTSVGTLQPVTRQRRSRSGSGRKSGSRLGKYIIYAGLFILLGVLIALFLKRMDSNETLLDLQGPLAPASEAAP